MTLEKPSIPEADIDELMAMFENHFTREQVQGYLMDNRQYEDGKQQAIN